MEFCELLNHYMEQIDCTSKELSEHTKLSLSSICRYRLGERTPRIESVQMENLIQGLSNVAMLHGFDDIRVDDIRRDFLQTLRSSQMNDENAIQNINLLIQKLDINTAHLARFLNYDASYISRIRSMQRHPAHMEALIDQFCNYVEKVCDGSSERQMVASLVGCKASEIEDNESCHTHLKQWILTNVMEEEDTNHSIMDFIGKLDEFNMEEYIQCIHFDEIKIPSAPSFLVPLQKHYFGVEEYKKGELDFFKATVLSKSLEPVYMHSDMPMADMAEDVEFAKKWMFGLAVMIKKGIHINIIHHLDRPFDEMMLGLESWIPLYMTGLISPYYLSKSQTEVFHHFHYSSKEAALFGECIHGHHDEGYYYLTRKKEEVGKFRRFTEGLFEKALPLMEIYRVENQQAFANFLQSDRKKQGIRRHICASLPLYTISDNLLERILTDNCVSETDRMKIRSHVAASHKEFRELMESGKVIDEVQIVDEASFDAHPFILNLSHMFYEHDIYYTYAQYQEHLLLTHEMTNTYDRYVVEDSVRYPFRNIQITMHEGKWAMISKSKNPVIHFVIYHPKLRDAIENMVIAVEDYT